MKKTILTTALLSIIASNSVLASAGKEASQEQPIVSKAIKADQAYPGLLGKLKEKGVVIDNSFKVSKEIDGYVIKQGGTSSIVYSAGEYVFSGVIFDPNGNNISSNFADKYIPKPDAGKMIAEIKERGSFVKEGASDREIFVFVDPNCGYCEKYYKATRQLVRDGDVTINWIPVGFLRPDSKTKAAYILSAENKVQAMQDLALGYAPKGESVEGLRDVAINQELMQKAGIGGTPGIIYKADGKWVVATNGLPAEKILETID